MYTSSVPLRAGAVVAVACAAAVIAAVSGSVSHLAARWIYLVLVAPVAVGFAIGASLAALIRRVHLAAPGVSSLIASLAVIGALGLHLWLDFAHDRGTRASQLRDMRELKMDIGYEIEDIEADYAEAMDELSLEGYLSRRFGFAADGAAPTSGFGASLGPIGSITLATIEVFLAAFIAVSFARQQAREPACDTCGAWRVHHKLGVMAYGVSRQLVDALVSDDTDRAATLLAAPDTREHVALTLLACPRGHDGDRGVIRIVDHQRERHRKPSMRHVADLDVTDRELTALRTALTREAA